MLKIGISELKNLLNIITTSVHPLTLMTISSLWSETPGTLITTKPTLRAGLTENLNFKPPYIFVISLYLNLILLTWTINHRKCRLTTGSMYAPPLLTFWWTLLAYLDTISIGTILSSFRINCKSEPVYMCLSFVRQKPEMLVDLVVTVNLENLILGSLLRS
jgi:hypothetical protein